MKRLLLTAAGLALLASIAAVVPAASYLSTLDARAGRMHQLSALMPITEATLDAERACVVLEHHFYTVKHALWVECTDPQLRPTGDGVVRAQLKYAPAIDDVWFGLWEAQVCLAKLPDAWHVVGHASLHADCAFDVGDAQTVEQLAQRVRAP